MNPNIKQVVFLSVNNVRAYIFLSSSGEEIGRIYEEFIPGSGTQGGYFIYNSSWPNTEFTITFHITGEKIIMQNLPGLVDNMETGQVGIYDLGTMDGGRHVGLLFVNLGNTDGSTS